MFSGRAGAHGIAVVAGVHRLGGYWAGWGLAHCLADATGRNAVGRGALEGTGKNIR